MTGVSVHWFSSQEVTVTTVVDCSRAVEVEVEVEVEVGAELELELEDEEVEVSPVNGQ